MQENIPHPFKLTKPNKFLQKKKKKKKSQINHIYSMSKQIK